MDKDIEKGICNPTFYRLDKGLEDYIECEMLLNAFFAEVNYCIPECISQEIGKYTARMEMPGDPTQFPGNIGCCPYDMFEHSNYASISDRTLLDRKRLEKYGEPKQNSSTCGYHGESGCVLSDHKSPVCLAYVCPEFINFVYRKYNIRYCKDEIEQHLELILSNKQSPEDVQKFKDMIQYFIDKIKNNN